MTVTANDPAPLEFLQLVADPVRWQLLHELVESDRRVNELTELLAKPQSLVSYHLRELRAAGLVAARRSSADGRDTYYRIDSTRCARLFSTAGTALQPGVNLTAKPAPPPPMRTRRARGHVLFLCTGNSARSQMAEALLHVRSAGTMRASSAGSHPKPVHPYAVRAMRERGIDISERTSKHLRRFARTHFDSVVTMCDRVREVCPEFPSHPRLSHWSIADPSLADPSDEGNEIGSYTAFQRTADDIDDRVAALVARLAQPIKQSTAQSTLRVQPTQKEQLS